MTAHGQHSARPHGHHTIRRIRGPADGGINIQARLVIAVN
jgi:hypothetical protein